MEVFLTVFIMVSLVSALFNLFDIPVIPASETDEVLTLPAGILAPRLTHTFVNQFSVIFMITSTYYL